MDGYNVEAVVVTQIMAQRLKEARRSGNELADLVNQLRERLEQQNEQLSRLLGQGQADTMHIAGLEAARAAYMKHHPDSHLLKDSGKRFKDGDVKTNARLIYESAFDAKGREIGVDNPANRRVD